ncbi:MAG: hypothetical protein KDD40_05980 [Bdellovibrionales bacterium]|nr:hypothetical protein [Bdellovibrionales bacterium]
MKKLIMLLFLLNMPFVALADNCEIYSVMGEYLGKVDKSSQDVAFRFQAIVGEQTLIREENWEELYQVSDVTGNTIGFGLSGYYYFDWILSEKVIKPRFIGSSQWRQNRIDLYPYMGPLAGFIKDDLVFLLDDQMLGYGTHCSTKELATGAFFIFL